MNIRLIKSGDESACNDFHNRLFGENRKLSQWRWAFADNTYDKTPTPYAIAEDNGKVVGTQAFIPIRLIDRNGIYWTAKSEASLVDSDYRGQQLFRKIYDLLFQYAEEHDFASVWGFTAATKALIPLKFAIPGITQQLFMPFSSGSVTPMLGKLSGDGPSGLRDKIKAATLRIGSRSAGMVSAVRVGLASRKLPSGLEIRTMRVPDAQAGELCQRFIKQWGGTTIYRDSKYIKWRLFDNPYVKSIVRGIYEGEKLLGWVAYTLGDDGLGYLVDMLISSDESRYKSSTLARILLLEAIFGTRNMGATGIRGWRVNQHPFDRLICREARKLGFYHIKRGRSFVFYTSPTRQVRAGHDDFDSWYISRVYTEGVLG